MARRSFQREIVSVRFVRIERLISNVRPACDFFSRSEEREEAAACMSEGRGMSWQRMDCGVISSLMKIRIRTGLRTLLSDTAALTGRGDERIAVRVTCWLRE